MAIILQISIEVNSGSVGRIAEQIGLEVLARGWVSYVTYARNNLPSRSITLKIGNKYNIYWHGLKTRIFDNHCLESKSATKKLISNIEQIRPDIIHLHHIHGYFINMKILFEYLQSCDIPIVWTFHDCWAFTGHCAHYEFIGCEKWKTGCFSCEQKKEYPASYFIDRSKTNYLQKRALFNSLSNLTIVPVSNWLKTQVEQSFLNKNNVEVIHNGIDIDLFKPIFDSHIYSKYKITNRTIVLGVASKWDNKKGFEEFFKLNMIIKRSYTIVLVGLSKSQIKKLPDSIIGIERTENVFELAKLYSMATVFVNPTFEDTFPTTNLESLACGTPVITYRTGGSVESISEDVGFVVEKGDVDGICKSIDIVVGRGKDVYSKKCRNKAEMFYNRTNSFKRYISLYEQLLSNKKKHNNGI
ncbi:glycosyltransferase [Alistipes sp. ZOR0009]|uniref:glycosyltransferase n=1 Tax=Alistipes sp. ZOR0009 TaxID=1339253 RepID=UPI0006466E3A|nr:glycosyltransferase [Alistipes sp. ZOR0009]